MFISRFRCACLSVLNSIVDLVRCAPFTGSSVYPYRGVESVIDLLWVPIISWVLLSRWLFDPLMALKRSFFCIFSWLNSVLVRLLLYWRIFDSRTRWFNWAKRVSFSRIVLLIMSSIWLSLYSRFSRCEIFSITLLSLFSSHLCFRKSAILTLNSLSFWRC